MDSQTHLLAQLQTLVAEGHANRDLILRQLQVLEARLGNLEAAMSQNVGDLVRGFGRLDESIVAFGGRLDAGHGAVTQNLSTLSENLVAFGSRMDASASMLAERLTVLDETTVAFGGRLDAGHGAVTQNLRTLSENVVAFGARMDASASMLAEHLTVLDETTVAFGERLDAGHGAVTQNLSTLSENVVAFGTRMDASASMLAEHLAVLDETTVAFGGRLDAGHGAVTQNLSTLSESVAAFGTRMDASASMLAERLTAQEEATVRTTADLVQAFGRLDAAVVGTGEALTKNADASVRTAWEAKAALSAELKDLPQQFVDAGIGGGGLARTDDDVPAGDLLFPHASRVDVEPIDLATDMSAFGKHIAEIAAKTAEAVVSKLKGVDFSPMACNSPELKDINWAPYIECSAIRVARTLAALERHVPKGAHVLDFGAYFGNFSLALAASGYVTAAVDAYRGPFGGAMAPFAKMMTEAEVTIHDVADVGYDFAGLSPNAYDAVLFMSAIEHVPHTPRLALEAINRVLKPGGVLVLDTPNLGYAYNRRKFVSGGTVFPPIEFQFETEVPFFGHHREYLPREISWMLERVGHEIIEKDMFNYSFYGMSELRGEHLALWRLMQDHPQMRELIFTISRKL